MMSTQQQYRDVCILCGRELIGNGTKIYKAAHEIRRVIPTYLAFRGETLLGGEVGAFICRSSKKCGRPDLQAKLRQEVPG